MATTLADFENALECWRPDTGRPDLRDLYRNHWLNQRTVIDYAHERRGRLDDDALATLEAILKALAEPTGFAQSRARETLQGVHVDEEYAGQLATVTRALLSGIRAAHHMHGWRPGSGRPPPEAAIESLKDCLELYHSAWDLFSRPVDGIRRLAGAQPSDDPATAALDCLHDSFGEERPEWWTQSNWLLVRRLLSYLLHDPEINALAPDNRVQMLLAAEDKEGRWKGLTAPLSARAHPEGWPAAYLDPIALGVTMLGGEEKSGDNMLTSLRIAARICRPDLEKREPRKMVSLRIGLETQTKGLALVTGESAGGLATLAACATAQGRRLNRGWSASFRVSAENQDKLSDVEHVDLRIEDVRLGPVGEKSIQAKLSKEALKDSGVTTVLLHSEQKSNGRKWKDWVPHIQGVQVRPVEPKQPLATLLDDMTGDERIEKIVQAYAKKKRDEWDHMRGGKTVDGEVDHMLDTHVAPQLRVELRRSEMAEKLGEQTQRPPRGQAGVPDENGFRTLAHGLDEFMRDYIEREWNWILITEQAGGGKTVLTWQLQAELSGADPPYLVVRYENDWPDLRQGLEQAVLDEPTANEQVGVPNGVSVDKVIEYLARRRRIVVILDALDQLDDETAPSLKRLRKNVGDRELSSENLRVIVTSRPRAVTSRPSEFDPALWRSFHLLPFDESQQQAYVDELVELWDEKAGKGAQVRASWETITANQRESDLLKLPINLRHVREMIEDHLVLGTEIRPFRTAGDLRWETAYRNLDRLPFKAANATQRERDVYELFRAASCLAFEMLRQKGTYQLDDMDDINDVIDQAQHRFGGSPEAWERYNKLLQDTVTTRSAVLRMHKPAELSFPSLKTAEFFVGLYLARYADDDAIKDLLPHIGDERWEEAWTFAIEMVETTNSSAKPLFRAEAYRRSLLALFTQPTGPHLRPTKLMYRAWQILEQNQSNRQLAQIRDDVLSAYRKQFLDKLAGDLPSAQRAAELLLEDDLRKLVEDGKTDRWTFEELRPDAAKHPAYALCSDEKTGDAGHLTFMMGASPKDKHADDDEKLWRMVQLPSYYMATCAVTRAQYRLFDPQLERRYKEGDYGFEKVAPDDDCAVIRTNFFDAACFTLWLPEGYRLPSEFEWEGAAWGGIDRTEHQEYVIGVPPYNDSFTTDHVNFDGNHPMSGSKSTWLQRTLPVRWDEKRRKQAIADQSKAAKLPAYEPNGFELWQMHGNVWEWCASIWDAELLMGLESGKVEAVAAEQWSANAHTELSLRGGSWDSVARNARASNRVRSEADIRDSDAGFRLTRTR